MKRFDVERETYECWEIALPTIHHGLDQFGRESSTVAHKDLQDMIEETMFYGPDHLKLVWEWLGFELGLEIEFKEHCRQADIRGG